MQKTRSLVGQRLKDWVNKNFKSQSEFARAMGQVPAYFTPYFNGSSLPGGEILTKIAEMGCDISWLLTGTPANQSGSGNINGAGSERSIIQSGVSAGHQITGDISGKSFRIKEASPETPEDKEMAEHYRRLIERKDRIIRELTETIEQEREAENLTAKSKKHLKKD